MVVIELEPEPEETTRPASPVRGEHAAAAIGGEAAPRPPSAPEEQVGGAASGESLRAEDDDEEEEFEDALTDEQLREKVRSQANDAKAEGNKLFGAGQYEEALSQYEMALQIASELEFNEDICSACHSNRAVCFLKLGKYDDTIKECTKALELNPTYMKALLRRAEAHEKLEHYDEAIADMKKILEFDPSNQQAKRSVFRLEPLADEKREKLKEEMIAISNVSGLEHTERFASPVQHLLNETKFT